MFLHVAPKGVRRDSLHGLKDITLHKCLQEQYDRGTRRGTYKHQTTHFQLSDKILTEFWASLCRSGPRTDPDRMVT